MLALRSPRWQELEQAFGTAEDIPGLLDALGAVESPVERAELWMGVWATLCPDGNATPAGYAALPHLLRLARARSPHELVTAIHFAVTLELSRIEKRGAAVPPDLLPFYAAAIELLPALVAQLSGEPWDDATAQLMAAALLAGKRHGALARAVMELGSDAT